MNEFVDIPGASGAAYRFRRIADLTQMPAEAGNFIIFRLASDQGEIICCGAASSLARADKVWAAAVEQHAADAIFVRLNISRNVRDAEHQDIVQHYRPAMVVAEVD